MKSGHFYPLLAFLIPTLLIGYGVVIPRSPIVGLNEFTIRFGSTLLGAAVAFGREFALHCAGKRKSARKTMRRPDFHEAVGRACRPRGWFVLNSELILVR